MKAKRIAIFLVLFSLVPVLVYQLVTNLNLNLKYEIGTVVDSLHGVNVYYNGGVNHVLERNKTEDGYNIGLKYQCVEFVKRYYLEHYNHKMPDTYGHAKDFFEVKVQHGELNPKRGLRQYDNGGDMIPKVGDLVVYLPTNTNPYGHVAIVSNVDLKEMKVEIIQQNPGPFSDSRETYKLSDTQGWMIYHDLIIGWLRL